MERKIYNIANLDCAHCAAKIEEKLNALPSVQEAVIAFEIRQLFLTAEDPDSLLPEVVRTARTVESEVEITPRETRKRMQRKVYTISNLDCAHCAAKIEEKLNDLPKVQEAVIAFETRQLFLTAEDPDSLLPDVVQTARTVESEVEITPKEERHRHGDCCHEHHHDGCCHEHHHDGCCHEHHHDECCHGHHHGECCHDHAQQPEKKTKSIFRNENFRKILLGAALFILGILLEGVKIGNFPVSVPVFVVGYLILGWKVLRTAVKNMSRGQLFDENFLMGIATIGAFAINQFPEAVGVMLFYCIGEYFEENAVERSRTQIMEAIDLRPEVVNLVQGDSTRVIPAEEAMVGDTLMVRPGDRIPLDGVVIEGESRIDTAPITGEPVPVRVVEGDSLTSGCINGSGKLLMRVEKELSESMVTRILNSVENAAARKPKINRFITRFAHYYTPFVVGLAAFVALVPSLVTGNWNYWVYTALSFLVISCPCALVLSVPLAFFSGIGAGSKRSILFKGGSSLEALAAVNTVVMDKTGTITRGDFRVVHQEGSVLALAASAEQHSTHPIALSIVEAAQERALALETPEKLEEIAGQGVKAVIGGKTVLCGNERLLSCNQVEIPKLEDRLGTQVLVAVDGVFAGCLTIADTLKDGTREAMGRLRNMGLSTAMLTGDKQETADRIASEVGIDEVHAKLLPEDKLEHLQEIRTQKGAVMFVGDGINDAPVLAGADVGAAMGSGADAAIEAADVVFMTSDVQAIPEAVEIARHTKNIAWQNVIFALAIKLGVMVLGLYGYASMWMAVFADSGVAMLCVLNSIRILYMKK